eukprot:TRINITY_DN9876_c0_g1_i1.p1 TRINITY_DN9876_c0_g1~~TRINITY_DN9876_c0_g1_i1.p1  ORF type:complete len:253 (+),score=54.74 TRINITY_DN9876_c0_g1_i1:57-761(+)
MVSEKKINEPVSENKLEKEEEEEEEEPLVEVSQSEDTTVPKPPEASTPPPPAAPEFKLSQLVPLAVMFGMQKLDIEKLGLVRHAEVAFLVVQVICIGLLYILYQKIDGMIDDGEKLRIPEVKQFGQVVTPATEQTVKQYDMSKLQEQVKQAVMGAGVLGCVYYKWQYVMPLVLQVFMTPLQLYESPLFQIHFIGKTHKRPFPTANPFGFPSAPTPAEAETPPAVAESSEGKKDK